MEWAAMPLAILVVDSLASLPADIDYAEPFGGLH